MLLLALDTSTNQSSIALCSATQVYSEQTWNSRNNHSVELLSNIKRMMAECTVTMQQLDAVAVATGPGSFNGVRVALATAKALAFALRKPLFGMSTLECIAVQQQQWRGPVCALLDAGRSELYAACYQFIEQRPSVNAELVYQMHQLGDYLLLTPQDLATYVLEQFSARQEIAGERDLSPMLFSGEISSATREALVTQLQDRCLFASATQSVRRAGYLATLAHQRLLAGAEDDPLALEPLYLRRPSITTSTRKQPLLGGTAQKNSKTTTEREEGAVRH